MFVMFGRFAMWLDKKRHHHAAEPDLNVYERERIRHEEKLDLERRLEHVKAQLLELSPRKQDISFK